MISFRDFINEKLNDNYLYHLADKDRMTEILKTDKVLGKMSLTRNKNLKSVTGTSYKWFQIVFDKDKLRNNYKIVPYADRATGNLSKIQKEMGYTELDFSQENSESEEIVSNVKNISRYIVEIRYLNYDDDVETLEYEKENLNNGIISGFLDRRISSLKKRKELLLNIDKKFKFIIQDKKKRNIKLKEELKVIDEIIYILEIMNKNQ